MNFQFLRNQWSLNGDSTYFLQYHPLKVIALFVYSIGGPKQNVGALLTPAYDSVFNDHFLACRLKRQAQDVLRPLTHSLTLEVIFFFFLTQP